MYHAGSKMLAATAVMVVRPTVCGTLSRGNMLDNDVNV